MNAQMNQGMIPASLIRPDPMIAKFLPITAMLPLSKYRKGRGGLPPLISLAIHSLAIHSPTYRHLDDRRRRRSSSSSVDSANSYALKIFERIACASVTVFEQGAYGTRCQVNTNDFRQQHGHVFVELTAAESARRHQRVRAVPWLEDVMVATIDDRHIGFAMSQCFDGGNAGEAAAAYARENDARAR